MRSARRRLLVAGPRPRATRLGADPYPSWMQNTLDQCDSHDEPRSWTAQAKGTRVVAVACGVLLAVEVVIGARHWLARSEAAADQSGQPVAYACGIVLPKGATEMPARERAYCQRAAADYGRRLPVSDEQRREAEALSPAVRKAASNGGWCMGPLERACLKRPSSHPPRPEDVDTARLWLAKTKASDSTARLARPSDPATVGSLHYAARVGDACIVGHVDSIPGGGGAEQVVGLLPGGRCLPD